MDKTMNSLPGSETQPFARSAAAYFRCDSLEEAEAIEERFRFLAEQRGLSFSGSVFDKPGRPPYSLLQLLSDGSGINSRYLFVDSFDCLSEDPELRDALEFRIRRKGMKLICPKKQPAVSAVENYLRAANDYFAVGGSWEEEHFPPRLQSDDRPTAGRVAYGYQIAGGRIVIDEKAAAVVRRIFELYAAGAAVPGISAEIEASFPSVPHPNLNRIYGIVRNGRYAGAGGAPDPYPPLVPLNIWFKCCAENEKHGYSEPDTDYLLPCLELADGTKLRPDPKPSCYAARRYRSADRNGPEYNAAAIESALLESIELKVRDVKDILTVKCAAAARNEHIRLSALLASRSAEYSSRKAEFEAKYLACERLPYSKAISDFERDRAELRLIELRCDHLNYLALEHGIGSVKFKEFFDRLASIGMLSRSEQRFFIDRLVKKARLEGGMISFSLPGFETVSADLKNGCERRSS